jgi:drug/metabolite transporter (DMT)-like permease
MPDIRPPASAASSATSPDRRLNRHALYLIAAMLFVGSNVGLGKTIVATLPVAIFALCRFAVAVAVLAPLYRPARMRRVARGEWLNLFLQALFGTFLFTLLMLYGLQRTSAVAAGVITSTLPAVVALFSWLFLKEPPDSRALVSIALAVLGVLVVNFAPVAGAGITQSGIAQSGSPHGGASIAGNLMVLGAVACESIYVILSRRLSQTLPALEICAYTHLFGLLLVLPLGLAALPHFDAATVPPGVWLLVLWYALSASVFAFWLWMKGIRDVPGSVAGVFTAAVPLAAAAYGIVFLHEKPGIAHAIALACVVLGIGFASVRPRREPPIMS